MTASAVSARTEPLAMMGSIPTLAIVRPVLWESIAKQVSVKALLLLMQVFSTTRSESANVKLYHVCFDAT